MCACVKIERKCNDAICRFAEVFVINGYAFAYFVELRLLDGGSECRCKLLKTDGA